LRRLFSSFAELRIKEPQNIENILINISLVNVEVGGGGGEQEIGSIYPPSQLNTSTYNKRFISELICKNDKKNSKGKG